MISVIIVNYNTSSLLQACIDSVSHYEPDYEIEFIIVDNKSEDNAEEIIDSIISGSKNVKKIMLDSNYGFAYANNIGFKLSRGEYLLILNPDVLFVESSFEKLINYSADKDVGAVGVKLFGKDGIFQRKYYQKHPSLRQYILFYSVLSKPFIGNEKLVEKYLDAGFNDNSSLQEASQIPGAFIFLKRKVYEEFKGFNETFFLFFEDVDLSYRISEKYKLLIADIKVVHIGASSMMMDTNYRIYGYYILSMLNFYRNNYSYPAYFNLKCIIFLNTIIKILFEYLKMILKIDKPGILKVHKYILINLLV
jgi:hypothetical protein